LDFSEKNSEKLEPPHCKNAMALDARISSLYGVNSDFGRLVWSNRPKSLFWETARYSPIAISKLIANTYIENNGMDQLSNGLCFQSMVFLFFLHKII